MEKKVIEVEIKDNVQSLKSQYKEAVLEVQKLVQTYGETSQEVANAAKRAAELKDQIEDTNDAIQAFKGEGVFNATGKAIQSVASGFSAVEGAMGLLGVESSKLQETLLRVQSAMALAQGLEGLEDAGRSFKQLGAVAVNAFNGMTKASKVFMVTGIGLLLTAIGTAIAYWDDLQDALGETNEAQDALNATMEDYRKGAQDAIQSTQKVESAFKLAKQGVISKEEALQTYNDTLGDSFGKATSLNEAEELYYKKTEAYVKATALRAQANALFAKAAEEQVKGITSQFEDQTTIADKWAIGLKTVTGSTDELLAETRKRQAKRAKEEQAEANQRAKSITDIAQSVLMQAEQLEKANGITSESENKLNEQRRQRAEEEKKRHEEKLKQLEEARLKAEEIERERIRNIKELENDFLNELEQAQEEYTNQYLSAQDREVQAVNDKYFYLIEQAKQYGIETAYLEEQRLNLVNDINVKYAQEEIDAEKAKQEEIERINKESVDKQIEDDKRLNQVKIDLVASGLSAVSDLIGAFTARNKKQAKAQFNAQKALGIASAIVDTYKGAQSAFASTPGGIVIKTIAAGVAVTAGLANVAKIAKTKIEDTSAQGGTGGVSIPQGATQTTTTPNFNVVGNSGVNQLATLQQQPVQAYVVSGQVTTAQALDRNRIQNATL
jgi:DNA repair exonuclease SbcCD ATPase subunit